jgi:hypothetical protein
LKVYVVTTTYQGCISGVKAFIDSRNAETYKHKEMKELGIHVGHEEESENDVQLHEVYLEQEKGVKVD